MDNKKHSWDAINCEECKWLRQDADCFRCELFDNAIIDDTKEKQCKDSIEV